VDLNMIHLVAALQLIS
jgi:hypothetical protein